MLRSFEEVLQQGVDDAVRLQEDAGLDIVSDGEMSKISYGTYIRHRLTGFDGDCAAADTPGPQRLSPSFATGSSPQAHSPTYRRPVCAGPDRSARICSPVLQRHRALQRALAARRGRPRAS